MRTRLAPLRRTPPHRPHPASPIPTRHFRPPLGAPQSNNARPAASRLDRLASRLPRRLRAYTARLRGAPVSHVVAFLILHEITAVVPLVGLFALFHYTSYVPVAYMTEHFGDSVEAGVARFERYFKRKGWFGFSSSGGDQGGTMETLTEGGHAEDKDEEGGVEARQGARARASSHRHTRDAVERSDGGERKYRILVEVALAYAATKALLPVRIVGSVWATPWFAGVLSRIRASVTGK